MPQTYTTAGKAVLDELTALSRAANFRAGDFKALRGLQSTVGELKSLKNANNALKSGLSQTTKTAKETANLYKDLNKRANELKKGVDDGKKLWNNLLKRIPGSGLLGKANKFSADWGAGISIGSLAAVQIAIQLLQKQVNDSNIANIDNLSADVLEVSNLAFKNAGHIKGIQEREKQVQIQINDVKEEIIRTEVNANFLKTQIETIKKQVNDTLYEARKGREIVESKIEAIKKQVNDTLYEVRKGREILESKINNFQKAVDDKITLVNKETKANIDTVKTEYQKLVKPLQEQISRFKTEIDTLTNKLNKPETKIDENAITKKAANMAIGTLEPRIKTIETNLGGNTLRVNVIADGLVALGSQLRITNGRVEILEKTPIKLPPQPNYGGQINDLNNRLKEQEKMNAEGNNKLDKLLLLIPAIPGKAADAIRPAIPTIPQIEQAAATGTCRTTQPGGCMRKMFDDGVGNINQNNNQNTGNILNALNTGFQIPELALLKVIDNKLGPQVKDGISSQIQRFTSWSMIDRITNLITMAATLHNAAMLSNDIITTLVSTISNILAVFGLKDAEGNAFDAGELIKDSIENFVKKAIGAENYARFLLTWNSANRIYQSGANIFNRLRNIFDHTRSIAETTNANVAEIGNALRRSGAVDDDAYGAMSRNVAQTKLQRVVDGLDNVSNVASSLESVTGSVRGIQDEIKELRSDQAAFKKAINDGIKAEENARKQLDSNTKPPTITEQDE